MLSTLQKYYPSSWNTKCAYYSDNKRYQEVEVSKHSPKYTELQSVMKNIGKRVTKITSPEIPYLYGLFLLTKAEYANQNIPFIVQQLYHDTAAANINSILNTNLDRRLACRIKFGHGVSFSPSTAYANRQSSRSNGTYRAMIVTDVLIGRTQVCNCHGQTLPATNNDTTTGNVGNVYVKFYDNEFYPKYIIYYENS